MAKLTSRVNFFRSILTKLRIGTAPIKEKSRKIYTKIVRSSKKRPLQSFFAILLILLILIAFGNLLRKPTAEETKVKEPIEVQTYAIGSAPRITLSAQIEKEGVIQIAAQTTGIVNKIHFREGNEVKKGQTLVSLSTNYQGANAASVQHQIALVQAKTAQETFNFQKDIIAKQREVAEKTDANADELASIAQKSIDETKSQISLNESILSTLDENLKTLEANNANGTNDALILQTKQLQSQFLATTNQSRSALRQSEISVNDNSKKLSTLQKEITLKQLDLQEKTLKLSVDAANLQTKLASINESLMFPTSPFTGKVERIHVRQAQQVAPGTPLITISTTGKSETAVVLVPQNIATSVSKLDSSFLIIDNERYDTTPAYVSTEAVSGQLYAIIYAIPQEFANKLTDKGFIDVEVPIGYSSTPESIPYVPLDAVHQTQDKAVVFVVEGEKAESKIVTLGQVQGEFIEIASGLNNNSVIIVSRNIVTGDPVKLKSQ